MKIRTLSATTAALGALLTIGIAGPPAASASPALASVSNFDLTFGATRLQGTIQWFDRSAVISGSLKAVTGTRQGEFLGSGDDPGSGSCSTFDERTAAAGTTVTFRFSRTCDINGGFDSFTVRLTDPAGSFLRQQIIQQP